MAKARSGELAALLDAAGVPHAFPRRAGGTLGAGPVSLEPVPHNPLSQKLPAEPATTPGKFEVIVIPMLSDNYSYYIYHKSNRQDGVFVDVPDVKKVKKFMHDFGLKGPVKSILTTHSHPDHQGANLALKKENPSIMITGGKADDVAGCTQPVSGGNTFSLFEGKVKVKCIWTPCHTKGHVVFYLEAAGCEDGTPH